MQMDRHIQINDPMLNAARGRLGGLDRHMPVQGSLDTSSGACSTIA